MTEQPTVDIITLENYAECLSPWDPSASNHLYALVDMGSNGIRFSISDLTPPQSRLLRCVYRERAGISLFDALTGPSPTPGDQNGASHQSSGIGRKPSEGPLVFPPEIIDQVAETLARFRRIADSYGVPRAQFSVLATEAMRRAANAGAMLTAIRNAAGIGIHVLAPPVETLFGAVMGSRSAFVDVARGGLFLDLGGGSVQMTWVDTTLPDYEIVAALAGESMPFGAARLIRVLEHQSEEVQALEKDKLRTSMQAAFAKLCDKFPDLKEASRTYAASNHSDSDSSGTLDELTGIDVYMCGGGFRGYGCMLMHNDPIKPYPIPSVGTYTVSGDFFKQTDRMRRTNTETEGKIYGMSARRRQQFPAIIEVVESFIEIVPNLRTVTFCAGSNRDGALLMKLPKSLRESNPLEVLAGITEAELPVARVALKALHDAVPSNKDLSTIPTIFSLGLGPLFARQIWVHQGEDDDANASYALHEAVTRDPSAPGLTHLARAVLGITVCARWGANLGPIDTVLHENLKSLIATVNHEAMFWAEYLGAVAAVMVDLVPVWPKSEDEIGNIIRFQATRDKTKKGKDRINLIVFISKDAGNGFDPDDVMNRIGKVGKVKGKKREIKVKARLQRLQT